MSSSETTRPYPVTDYEVLTGGTIILNLYKRDLPLFIKYSPAHYSEAVAEIMKEAITEGYLIHGDSKVRGDLTMKTDLLKGTITEFKKLYKGLSLFIDDAFAFEQTKKEQLGIGTISEEMRTQAGAMKFVNRYAQLLREYEPQLKAKGCPESRIKAVETLNEHLIKAHDDRDMFRIVRENKTVHRVAHYASIWEMMKLINTGAQVVHEDNPTLCAQYDLPKRKRGASEPETDHPVEVK